MLPNRFSHVKAVSITNPAVTSVLLLVLFVVTSYAGTWRDSFEDGILNGWQQPGHSRLGEIVGYEVHWTTGNDRLNVQVFGHSPAALGPITSIRTRAGTIASIQTRAFFSGVHSFQTGGGASRRGRCRYGPRMLYVLWDCYRSTLSAQRQKDWNRLLFQFPRTYQESQFQQKWQFFGA